MKKLLLMLLRKINDDRHLYLKKHQRVTRISE